jgi:hypothetical protein
MLFEDHSENDDQQSQQKHKNGNPVDRIHITNPTAGRFIGIFFPDIEVFCKFS